MLDVYAVTTSVTGVDDTAGQLLELDVDPGRLPPAGATDHEQEELAD